MVAECDVLLYAIRPRERLAQSSCGSLMYTLRYCSKIWLTVRSAIRSGYRWSKVGFDA